MTPQLNGAGDLMQCGWEIHPTVVAGCLGLLLWYRSARPRQPRHALPYVIGVLVLALSLISPLDPLGDEYLFSAHMLQHLLLILVVPPLLIIGLPPQRVEGWMRSDSIRRWESILGRPSVAWFANMAMMTLWHIPTLYNAANAVTSIHIFEHMTFLVTGCMFWWPIFTPLQQERLEPGRAMLYLFGGAVVSTVLGILITFLPVGHYRPYLNPSDELGALHLIRDTWGISASEDEKLAGLLMWVPACMIYFGVMLLKLGHWYQTPDPEKIALFASRRNSPMEGRHG